MKEKRINSYTEREFYRLLHTYIGCLDMYFCALHDACQLAKRARNKHIDYNSIEVIEKFIATGRKLQSLLRNLQVENNRV